MSRKALFVILKNYPTILGTIIMNNLIDYNYLVSYHLIVVYAVDLVNAVVVSFVTIARKFIVRCPSA